MSKFSTIKVNAAKTIAKSERGFYNIPTALEIMEKWFLQDKEFMKKLISAAVEYENKEGLDLISHDRPESTIVYPWSRFFSKFKPSITNKDRTKSRIEKGQILYKTENQTPNFYYVGASLYQGQDKPILDGMHTRAMEIILRILGVLVPNEDFKGPFMRNVIVLTFQKEEQEFENHPDIVVNQDSYRDVMDKKMTNRILASDLEDSFAMLHPFAQSQSARVLFANSLKVENTIHVFNNPTPNAILREMIASTIAMSEEGEGLNKDDVNFKLWDTTREHLEYENLTMPESVYANIMVAAYKLMSGKTPSKLEDVLDTISKFMKLDFKTVKHFQKESGSVSSIIFGTQIEDAIQSRINPDKMVNKNASSQTLANYAGTLIRDAVICFHSLKEQME